MKSKITFSRVEHLYKVSSLIILSFLASAFYSCENSTGNIDYEFIEDIEILQIDTLTIRSGTVNMDSVITGGSSRILSGRYSDTYLGEIFADSYLKVFLPSVFSVSEEAVYKSFKLVLELDYVYGVPDKEQNLYAHRVIEEIEPDEDEEFLYNFNKFRFEDTPLGTVTLIPEEVEDSIVIDLSDDLGKEIFNAAKEGQDFVSVNDDFQDFLKGIAIIGGVQENTSILGFPFSTTFSSENITTVPTLEITYEEPDGDVTVEKIYKFSLTAEGSFSNIFGERPLVLEDLKSSKDYLLSNQTNNSVFIQSGLGLLTKIEFPTLVNVLNNIPDNYFIVGAELVIKPIRETYKSETPLPATLFTFVADRKNNIEGPLVDFEGDQITANARLDEEFNNNTLYKFDITRFVESELNSSVYPSGRSLLISTGSTEYQNSVTRAVIGGGGSKDHKMFINIILYKNRI